MRKNRWKVLAVFLVISVIFASTAIAGQAAAGYKKMIEAWFGTTNIKYNDQDLTTYAEPFSWNQTTYIPLRKMADIFNKTITWDQATQTVILGDKPDPTIENLQAQLNARNYTISQLEIRIRELELELEERRGEFSELEEQLNDDYGEYRDIEFEIVLSGDEDEITVEIAVDLSDFKNEWNKLSTTRKTTYLQNICDDILDVYEDADIDGYFWDSSRSGTRKLLSFTTTSKGVVKLGTTSSSTDLDDLADELDDDYYDYFDDIEFDSVELEGDEDEITFTFYIDLDYYDDEWDDLDDDDIEDFMFEIRDKIRKEFKNAIVEGIIRDIDKNKKIAELYRATSGGMVFRRLK